jgi:hypothetical protein
MGAQISPQTTTTNGLDAGISKQLLTDMTNQAKAAQAALLQSNADLKELSASSMKALLQQSKQHDEAMNTKDDINSRERTQLNAQMSSMQQTSVRMMGMMMDSMFRRMPMTQSGNMGSTGFQLT